MKNEPVNLDTAKRLKSQGYNKPCVYYWLDGNPPLLKTGEKLNHNRFRHTYSAPVAWDAYDFLLDIALLKLEK